MKPAICTSFDYEIPFDRALELIRGAGFEVVAIGPSTQHGDYSTAAGRSAMQKLLDENGLSVDSVHAPFPEGDRLFSLDGDERAESIRQCEVAMDAAAELGGPIVVIHLIQPYDIPRGLARREMIEHGRRSVGALIEQAAHRGVKLALENGQRSAYDEVLADLLTEFDSEHVGFCYDSGHEHVQGTCCRMLEQFGHRLLTVHLHDNEGSDTHMLPYEGTIPWGRFREVFHDLSYPGNLLLEVSIGNSSFKDPEVFLEQAYERAGRLLQLPAR